MASARNIEKAEEEEEEAEGDKARPVDEVLDRPLMAEAAEVGVEAEAREEGERAVELVGEMAGTAIDGRGDAADVDVDVDEDERAVEATLGEARLRCLASASDTILIRQPTQYVGPSRCRTSAVWQMGHVDASRVQPATTRDDKSPTMRLLRSRAVSPGGGGEVLYVDMASFGGR